MAKLKSRFGFSAGDIPIEKPLIIPPPAGLIPMGRKCWNCFAIMKGVECESCFAIQGLRELESGELIQYMRFPPPDPIMWRWHLFFLTIPPETITFLILVELDAKGESENVPETPLH